MSANSFGHIFKVTTFGESHGGGLGVVIEGCPSGVSFDMELLKKNMNRRRPGQSSVTTSRVETDTPKLLSGVFEGRTLGTPIAIMIENNNVDSSSYSQRNLEQRKGHATDLWADKFGHSDPRGSGRASGRETASRVMAGSVGQMVLKELSPNLNVCAYVSQIGPIFLGEPPSELSNEFVDQFPTRMPKAELNQKATHLLEKAKSEGDSFGGVVGLQITGCPRGLGQPVFHKIKSDLASALMGIGAASSVRFGGADENYSLSGLEFHDSNKNYGGIRGGITTGEVIQCHLGFKPPATIGKMAKEGRHDPCILPRVVPVVEAMTHLVLVDHLLWVRLDRA